jgi:hypothetical protein
VSKTLSELGRGAIADLGAVSSAMPDNAADPLIEAVLSSKRICLYGAGSELSAPAAPEDTDFAAKGITSSARRPANFGSPAPPCPVRA